MDVSQAKVSPAVAVGKPLVIEAKKVQDGSVQIVHVHLVLDGELTEVVG
jgi:hypothetical protein